MLKTNTLINSTKNNRHNFALRGDWNYIKMDCLYSMNEGEYVAKMVLIHPMGLELYDRNRII